ncbi:hypothetical protein AB205_0053490 [Aquarana catesbeiana]|uniref:Uncharacterized protein n=1 Tax=Aquarana catesbeiana TaxID=8400 RepID=A0A2G9S417_AQUCT|nr:hypothetical protein AB205_0053490 [Aquarana catesbeiana]
MSGRPPRKGRHSQATKRGQAGSVSSVDSAGRGHAPPSCTEESPELFDHSVDYMLQEDAQRFEGSDDGTQVEEGSNVSLERGGTKKVKKLAVMFPQLQHTAKFAPVTRREGMMRSLTQLGCLIEDRRRRRHVSNEV